MNLIELLCAFAVIGVIVGLFGPSLPWPMWVSCLMGGGLCGLLWVFLLRQGRGQRQGPGKRSDDESGT